jgi:quercetin dioxygenase-like cupin family protein
MSSDRVFKSSDFIRPSEGDPIRSVITQSTEVVVIVWHVKQGQRIAAHIHPRGQDTWTILSGAGEYQSDTSGNAISIKSGDVVVALTNQIHGVYNPNPEPLIFISVVAPSDAGYELATNK